MSVCFLEFIILVGGEYIVGIFSCMDSIFITIMDSILVDRRVL